MALSFLCLHHALYAKNDFAARGVGGLMRSTTLGRFYLLLLLACSALLLSEFSTAFELGGRMLQEAAAAQHVLAKVALGMADTNSSALALYLSLFSAALALFAGLTRWLLYARTVPRGLCFALLLLQLLIGAAVESDLLYLLAAQVAFIRPFPRSWPWLLACMAALAFSFLPLLPLLSRATPLCNIPGVAPPPVFLDLITDYVQEVALQCFAFCIGYFAGSHRRNRDALLHAHGELLAAQRLLAEEVRAAERLRLNRRLHDALGENLNDLNRQLGIAAQQLQGPATGALQVAAALAQSLATEMHDIIVSEPTPQQALQQALSTLCAGIPAPRVELVYDEAVCVESSALAQAILLSVQEAISNALRHSGASLIKVAVSAMRKGVGIVIQDNGQGMRGATSGNGLPGMRERVVALGGELSLGNRQQGGFALNIWLPLDGHGHL